MLKDPCHSYLVLDALVFFKLVFFSKMIHGVEESLVKKQKQDRLDPANIGSKSSGIFELNFYSLFIVSIWS